MYNIKRESWNIANLLKNQPSKIILEELAQARSLQRNSPKAHPNEFTPVKLGFFSSISLKQVITHLSEMSLSPSPTRLNMKHEA